MTRWLAATACCALLAFQPASAKQGQAPGTAPARASPEATSAPPADPFKAGGRPESHGGTVHAPQVGAGGMQAGPAAALPDELRQTAEALARTTVTAQQYGNLASMRHTSGAVHDLGDRMIVTHSRINRALTALSPDLRKAEAMPEHEQATFDSLARQADEVQFGVSIAQWVAESYPQAIAGLERLAANADLRELATSAVPELRAQLSDAQRILQTARAAPGGEPSATGSVGDAPSASD